MSIQIKGIHSISKGVIICLIMNITRHKWKSGLQDCLYFVRNEMDLVASLVVELQAVEGLYFLSRKDIKDEVIKRVTTKAS